jgi:hypothetical protein
LLSLPVLADAGAVLDLPNGEMTLTKFDCVKVPLLFSSRGQLLTPLSSFSDELIAKIQKRNPNSASRLGREECEISHNVVVPPSANVEDDRSFRKESDDTDKQYVGSPGTES